KNLTHNQGVPGSSPGGPTDNRPLTIRYCKWLFFAYYLHTLGLFYFISSVRFVYGLGLLNRRIIGLLPLYGRPGRIAVGFKGQKYAIDTHTHTHPLSHWGIARYEWIGQDWFSDRCARDIGR